MVSPQPTHRPPPRPPMPMPPTVDPGDMNFEQMRELIEMQQRTIRFLIGSYNDLLDSLERKDVDFKVEWAFGDNVVFNNGDKIPAGWYQAIASSAISFTDHAGGHHTPTVDPYDFIFSDGEAEALATFTLVPVTSKIVREEANG